jgi:hypothetical protein
MRNILYLGFLGFTNLGDEVCYQSFLQNLARTSRGNPYRVIPYDLRNKSAIAQIAKSHHIDDIVIGGGSLLQGTAFIQPALEALSLKLPLWISGTGIDYMGEDYVKSILRGHFPEQATVFEQKEINMPALKKIFEYSRFSGVRGPLTLHFLARHCHVEKKNRIMGDPGFVYHPAKDKSILSALNNQPHPTGRIVAINWGGSYNSVFGGDERRVRLEVAQQAKHLISSGYRIVVFPMWDDDRAECRQFCHDVGMPERCILIPETPSINSVCTLLKKASFSINFKLHANVLSALMKTPFISLAYRSKCYDFALSLNLGAYCISTSDEDISAKIAHLADRISRDRKEIISSMKSAQKLYADRYDQFFERFWKTQEGM